MAGSHSCIIRPYPLCNPFAELQVGIQTTFAPCNAADSTARASGEVRFEQAAPGALQLTFAGSWRLQDQRPPVSDFAERLAADPAPQRVSFCTTALGPWDSGLVTYLARVVEDINATGYGLTLGLHSRNDDTPAFVEKRARVGNFYVNRNQIGAVGESQPFGGERLSGTGPKAGGPHYVARFATERVVCIDTTAAGGNATLLAS